MDNLDCFQLCAIRICRYECSCVSLCVTHIFICLGLIPTNGIAELCWEFCVWLFGKLPNSFPKWFHHLTFPPVTSEGSCFSISLPTFVVVCHIYYSHSSGCEVFQCGFNMHFPNDNNVEHPLIYLLGICISSLLKCLFISFVHFTVGFEYY